MTLELYHWEPTVNSAEVLILLGEKGLDFVSRYVDVLGFEQFSTAFRALNPRGQVPVLKHDGRIITETGFILQYLEESFPAPSFTPSTAKGRYDTAVWIKLVNDLIAPALWKLGAADIREAILRRTDLAAARSALERAPIERRAAWNAVLSDELDDDARALAARQLSRAIDQVETALAARPWLCGDAYSIADIAAFPAVRAAVAGELVDAEATPAIGSWLKRIEARTAVRASLDQAKTARPEMMLAPGPEGSRWG
jgi:glutathione S-transferase